MNMTLAVLQVQKLTSHIILIRLGRIDGAALPGYAPGAHIRVQVMLDGHPAWRHYSLINFDPAKDACVQPSDYCIAVRREDIELGGRGGSVYLHTQVQAGQLLQVSPPLNVFGLGSACDDVVLIAGGIGVTPLVSMAAALQGAGRSYALHYSGRSLAHLALLSELRGLVGPSLKVYADETDHKLQRLDLVVLLTRCRPSQPLYVCGPKGMVNAVRENATRLGWHGDDIHYELFSEAAPAPGDQPFEVELVQTGRCLWVPPEKTILDVMLEAGLDPMFDCKRGDCGVCTVEVLEGEVDHRDNCQSVSERAAGKSIQICISRAKGKRLLLDA
jgi:ferredoxin-NADP reductase